MQGEVTSDMPYTGGIKEGEIIPSDLVKTGRPPRVRYGTASSTGKGIGPTPEMEQRLLPPSEFPTSEGQPLSIRNMPRPSQRPSNLRISLEPSSKEAEDEQLKKILNRFLSNYWKGQ